MPSPSLSYLLRIVKEGLFTIISLATMQVIASACGTQTALEPLDTTHPASPRAMEGRLHTELLSITDAESGEVPQYVLQENHSHHHHIPGMRNQ